MPRRWVRLDEEQRAVAEELVRRALELRETSDGELSIREALNLAAAAIERRGPQALRPAVVEPDPVDADFINP